LICSSAFFSSTPQSASQRPKHCSIHTSLPQVLDQMPAVPYLHRTLQLNNQPLYPNQHHLDSTITHRLLWCITYKLRPWHSPSKHSPSSSPSSSRMDSDSTPSCTRTPVVDFVFSSPALAPYSVPCDLFHGSKPNV
jgi:hypothetical protein